MCPHRPREVHCKAGIIGGVVKATSEKRQSDDVRQDCCEGLGLRVKVEFRHKEGMI